MLLLDLPTCGLQAAASLGAWSQGKHCICKSLHAAELLMSTFICLSSCSAVLQADCRVAPQLGRELASRRIISSGSRRECCWHEQQSKHSTGRCEQERWRSCMHCLPEVSHGRSVGSAVLAHGLLALLDPVAAGKARVPTVCPACPAAPAQTKVLRMNDCRSMSIMNAFIGLHLTGATAHSDIDQTLCYISW